MNTDTDSAWTRLGRWIDERMTRSDFAKQVDCSESHLSLVLAEKRGASGQLATRIERATHGAFLAAEFFPQPEGVAR